MGATLHRYATVFHQSYTTEEPVNVACVELFAQRVKVLCGGLREPAQLCVRDRRGIKIFWAGY